MTTSAPAIPFSVTEKAAQHILHLMKLEGKTVDRVGLRVAVKGGGCSGLEYKLAFEIEPKEDDQVLEQFGVRLFLDPKSLFFVKGTSLDFDGGLNGKGLVFQNPNATKTCGCGSSFAV